METKTVTPMERDAFRIFRDAVDVVEAMEVLAGDLGSKQAREFGRLVRELRTFRRKHNFWIPDGDASVTPRQAAAGRALAARMHAWLASKDKQSTAPSWEWISHRAKNVAWSALDLLRSTSRYQGRTLGKGRA
jgi:hypothetical protein